VVVEVVVTGTVLVDPLREEDVVLLVGACVLAIALLRRVPGVEQPAMDSAKPTDKEIAQAANHFGLNHLPLSQGRLSPYAQGIIDARVAYRRVERHDYLAICF
jgi:hypothetical protein